MPAALRPPQGPGHTGATALPRTLRHRLQEVRPLADGRRAGCLHRCGGEAAEPSAHGPVGPLTGQQYWVRKDSAHAKVKVKPTKVKTATQLLQPQRVPRSTSGTHRGISRVSPERNRLRAVHASKVRVGSEHLARRMIRRVPPSQVLQNQKVTGSVWRRHWSTGGPRRWRMAAPSRRALASPGHLWHVPRVTRNTVARRIRRPKAEIEAKAKFRPRPSARSC